MKHLRGISSGFAAILLCASCASQKVSSEPWVYGISRHAYSDMSIDMSWFPEVSCGNSGEAALVLLGIVLLPVALDTVLLPVTIPHDLLARS